MVGWSTAFIRSTDERLDATQPAFLRRLRGQMTEDESGRHERPIPRNKRLKNDDEDDAPTYVLEESGQSLTKEEYEAMVLGKDSKETEETAEGEISKADGESKHTTSQDPKDKIAEVGKNTKKRKAAKIIGAEEQNEEPPKKNDSKVIKKPKKKAKPVKLSFGDQEEG
jgi:hypothetical protein